MRLLFVMMLEGSVLFVIKPVSLQSRREVCDSYGESSL